MLVILEQVPSVRIQDQSSEAAMTNEVGSHPGGALTPTKRDMLVDLRWATEHNAELEAKYLDEYVLIVNQQVVGHGTDAEQALREAKRAGFSRNRIVVVEDSSFFEAPR
jgi:hypothetical protein